MGRRLFVVIATLAVVGAGWFGAHASASAVATGKMYWTDSNFFGFD